MELKANNMKTIRELSEEIFDLSEANARWYGGDATFRRALKCGDLMAIVGMLPDTEENREYLQGFVRRFTEEKKQKDANPLPPIPHKP